MASRFFKAINFFKKKSNTSKIAPDIKQPRQLKQTMEKIRSENKKFGFTKAKTAVDRANIVRTKKSIERMNKVDELKKKRKEGIKASKEMKKMVDTKQAEKVGGTVYPHHVRERKFMGGIIGKGKKKKKEENESKKGTKPKDLIYKPSKMERLKELRKELKADGGRTGLKPVDKKKNPGLAKLPTKVRNKMGYMKDGGAVKPKGKVLEAIKEDYKKSRPPKNSRKFGGGKK